MNTKQEKIIQKLEEDLLQHCSQEELLGTRNFIREIAKNNLKNSKETPKALLEKYKKKFPLKNKRNKTSYDILKEYYATNNIISEIKNSSYILKDLINNKITLKMLSAELQETLSKNNKENPLLPSKIKENSQLGDAHSPETESDYLLLNLIEEITKKLANIKRANKMKAGISRPTNFIEKLFNVLIKVIAKRKSQPKPLIVVNELKQARSLKESKLLQKGLYSEEILDSLINSYIKLNLFKDKNEIIRHNSEISDLMSISKNYLDCTFNLKLDSKLDDQALKNVENFLQERSHSLQEYLVKDIRSDSSSSIIEAFLEGLAKEAMKTVSLSTNAQKSLG